MQISAQDIIRQQHEKQIRAIQLRRSHFMDVLEALLSHHDNWEYLRRKALAFLGKNGLEGDLDRIAEETFAQLREGAIQ